MKHLLALPAVNYAHPQRIVLIGAGGTGSQVLTGLARLHTALLARGQPGLEVTVCDPKPVTEATIGRQLFAPADIGRNKAEVLVHRLNLFFGLTWQACPENFNSNFGTVHMDPILISCVDTRKARASIMAWCKSGFGGKGNHRAYSYLLDCGNGLHDGQVLLGQRPCGRKAERKTRLPHPYRLFPDLIDKSKPEDNTPSCSLLEALEKQSLFINQLVATHALQLLANLLLDGGTDHCGVFFNARTGRSHPLPVDPDHWKRINPKYYE